MLTTMERDSNAIYQEIITLRSDADASEIEQSEQIEELLSQYQQALKAELLRAIEILPFSLVCDCDADGPAIYAEAIAEGWTNIIPDDGFSWNFLGCCPTCTLAQAAE